MIRQQEYFIESCIINDVQTVNTLIHNKVDVTVQNYWGYRICACQGYFDLLKILYQTNSEHSEIAKSGILAWTAATSKQYDIVEYIISLSDAYKHDISALQWVAAGGDIKMMQLVLPYCEYFDWIFVSAAKNGQVDMVNFLLDNEIERFDKEFKMTFNNAVLSRQKKVAKLLIDRDVVHESDIDKVIFEKYLMMKDRY